jgi:hypothetical protein
MEHAHPIERNAERIGCDLRHYRFKALPDRGGADIDADTAWSEVQCKRAGGVAIRPRVAASDPNIEDPERPRSPLRYRPIVLWIGTDR